MFKRLQSEKQSNDTQTKQLNKSILKLNREVKKLNQELVQSEQAKSKSKITMVEKTLLLESENDQLILSIEELYQRILFV